MYARCAINRRHCTSKVARYRDQNFLRFLFLCFAIVKCAGGLAFSSYSYNVSMWSPHLDFRATSQISSVPSPPPPIRRSQIDHLYFTIGTPNNLFYLFRSISTLSKITKLVSRSGLVFGTNEIEICAQGTAESRRQRFLTEFK